MSGPFIRFFANHPTAANLLMLIFIFLGLGTVQDIRRETFPDFTPKEVEIIVTYPGASTEEIEEEMPAGPEVITEKAAEPEEGQDVSK